MYKFCTTERNNSKANEYETKSMLYLLSYRKDSNEIDTFIIDCFNDVTGASNDMKKLWDVQSKNVNSLNPTKVGISLITLFQNYISDIDFKHYILFMPKLNEMYLKNHLLSVYYFDNFFDNYKLKITEGLKNEYYRRNKAYPDQLNIDKFSKLVSFVSTTDDKVDYIKNIIKFKNPVTVEDSFFMSIFDEIRDRQSTLKNINIEGQEITKAEEVIKFEKVIQRNEIDILILNRFVGVDLFTNKMIPNLFFDEIKDYNAEERKDIIEECNASIAKVLFNKNNKKVFWNFFESLILLIKENRKNSPRIIYQELKKTKTVIPSALDDFSVIYLISILKEGLTIED